MNGPRFALASFLSVVTLGAQTPRAQPPPQATFRSGTELVAVDVRVLDNRGQPVTDLTSSDFTVYENGVKQEISQFMPQALTRGAPDPKLTLRPFGSRTAIAPQQRRLFLIMLGRGRLQGPSKGLDALVTFVRERLMPQDLVAVMAWDRATDFTPDHELVASLIERFKPRHEAIETEMGLIYDGLTALYAGGRPVPENVRRMIDNVFDLPGVKSSSVPAGAGATTAPEQTERQLRMSALEVQAAEYRRFNTSDLALGDLMGESPLGPRFNDYVSLSRQTLQDVGNLYAAIDYLRFLDGEKHVLLVTEQGFLLPTADSDRDLAAFASDARVAIDTFQTGGVAVGTKPIYELPPEPAVYGSAGDTQAPRVAVTHAVTPANAFALGALRTVSTRTGGQVFVSAPGLEAVDAIARATEFGYVLGYASTAPTPDGTYRNINVEVTRKGVTLNYRHGYFARPPEAFDPRKAIATTRMIAAANMRADVTDLKVGLKVADSGTGNDKSIIVDAVVQPERIGFAQTDKGYFSAMNMAVLLADVRGDTYGDQWKAFNVDLTPEQFAEVRKTGMKLSMTVPIKTPPAWVKVIVYDYGADLLGTVSVRRY